LDPGYTLVKAIGCKILEGSVVIRGVDIKLDTKINSVASTLFLAVDGMKESLRSSGTETTTINTTATQWVSKPKKYDIVEAEKDVGAIAIARLTGPGDTLRCRRRGCRRGLRHL
jgi:hypothetical protein